MTYFLQFSSVAAMLMAIYLGSRAAAEHSLPLVIANTVLFAANLALFIFQQHIRTTQNKGR